jgi:plasmid stabilization system protein ParE
MSERKYNVYIAPVAGDKLFAHIRFLAQASVSAAERLYDALCATIDDLEDNPRGYPLYTSLLPMDTGLHYKLWELHT